MVITYQNGWEIFDVWKPISISIMLCVKELIFASGDLFIFLLRVSSLFLVFECLFCCFRTHVFVCFAGFVRCCTVVGR